MDVRVLGPVELVERGRAIPLPAEKQRRLLAALAVNAGKTVAVDVLIEAVWPSSAPASAAKLVQVYVSQLRKLCADGLRIDTRDGGYALVVDSGSFDVTRFERLLAQGAAARDERNHELALALFDRALALWRGPAYGTFIYDDFARAEVERLEELKSVAFEGRFEAGLALGRHEEFLPELHAHSGEHPLRERLQAYAMVALYRCGRQVEALDLYATTRKRLQDELGLEPGRELRTLQRRILEQDPTLRVASTEQSRRADLPVPPNPLLGREREIAELRELITHDDVRLLVLTGAGGSGKTRLALEASRDNAASFANGAAFVPLAPVRDPELVVSAIVRTLAIEEGGDDELETLTTFLDGREFLLVLDNAEHLHEAMPIVAEILARAERLTVLVTSRRVLHLSGEHVYPVQPLGEDGARALFEARARQADARFAVEPADEEPIGRICARLDGLPLAIELAAARTTSLRPHGLLERLDARLPLLTGGPRDLPARQQTLRATLEWSFALLTSEDRELATSLVVFVGPFDLEAAQDVCGATAERLTPLVEQSFLQRTVDARFAYLETVREYVLEQLASAPEADELRRRHFRYFLKLAEAADLSAVRRRGGERLDVAEAARDNLRAALAWSLETGSIPLGLELASAMERYWVTHDPREGMRWFGALLSHPDAGAVDPALRADALRAYGSATDIAGDDDAARGLYERSLTLFEELGDQHGRAVLLHRLGISAMRRGDLALARELVEESHAIHEQSHDRWGLAQTIGTLGAIARDSGDTAEAADLVAQSLSMAREAGVRWWEAGMLAELAALALRGEDIDEADIRVRESLTLARDLGDRGGQILGVGLLAAVDAARGDHERAERLWSAVAAEDAVAPLGGWRRHRADVEARIEHDLDRTLRGRPAEQLSLDEAVSLALG